MDALAAALDLERGALESSIASLHVELDAVRSCLARVSADGPPRNGFGWGVTVGVLVLVVAVVLA